MADDLVEPEWVQELMATTPPPLRAVPEDKRKLRSRSYLSILTILREPALRARVLPAAGSSPAKPRALPIEFDELHAQVCIDRRLIVDNDASVIRAAVEQNFQGTKEGDGMKFTIDDIERALLQVSLEHRFHPVQEYLVRLQWDGTDRIPELASRVLGLGTAVTALDIALLRKWMLSAVARAMQPGCKVDTVLVLVGPQGARKSTFFRVLASDAWFSDSSFDPSSKDGMEAMSGSWIYEWPELESMQRARSQNSVKAFVTSQEDEFRPSYGRHRVRRPRTCVIVGTSNDDDFLVDPTGARRYWPIRVMERIDTDLLKDMRDQLWAQAMELYLSEERWTLTPEEEQQLIQAQRAFQQTSAWDDILGPWLISRADQTLDMATILEQAFGLSRGTWSKGDEQKAGAAMKRCGWTLFRARLEGGQRPHRWRKDPLGSVGPTDPDLNQ